MGKLSSSTNSSIRRLLSLESSSRCLKSLGGTYHEEVRHRWCMEMEQWTTVPVIRQSRGEVDHIHSILFIGDPFVRGSHVPNARVYSRSFPLSDTEGNWATLLVEADYQKI